MLTEIIGEGAFGPIYLSQVDNKGIVLKRINYDPSEPRDNQSEMTMTDYSHYQSTIMSRTSVRELTFLSHLNSPYVIKPIKIDDEFIYMPYFGTDLSRVGKLSWQSYLSVFYQTLLAISDIHRSNIVHGDIKPQNILMNKNGQIKICDFNLASLDNGQLRGNAYTSSYRPLEVIFSTYNYKSDIWALGCTMWELYFGQPLFSDITRDNALEKIENIFGSVPENVCKKYNIPKCSKTTSDRILNLVGIKKLISHRSAINTHSLELNKLLISMLNYDRNCRPNAAELLNSPIFREQQRSMSMPPNKLKIFEPRESIRTFSMPQQNPTTSFDYKCDCSDIFCGESNSDNYHSHQKFKNTGDKFSNLQDFSVPDSTIYDQEQPAPIINKKDFRELNRIMATDEFSHKITCVYNNKISLSLVNSLFIFMVKFHNFQLDLFYYWICYCFISLLYIGHELDPDKPDSKLGLSEIGEIDFGLALQDTLQKCNYNLIHIN